MTDLVKVIVKPSLVVATVRQTQTLIKVFPAVGHIGLTGLKGDTGSQGETGPQGVQGLQGIQGVTGLPGEDGVNGVDGEDGAQGLKGDKGDKGADGAKGEAGAQGIQGVQGIQGLQGPAGADGIDGADGADGSNGAPGPNLVDGSTATTLTGVLVGNGSVVSAKTEGHGGSINADKLDTLEATDFIKKDGSVDLTGYLGLYAGTTGIPAEGDVRYNPTDHIPEFYDGAAWQSADCPKYLEYLAATISASNYNLTGLDGSKILIKWIFISCTSQAMNWDATLYSKDDFTSDPFQIVNDRQGDMYVLLDYPYYDKDNTSELHIKLVLNSGSGTFTIKVLAMKMR